MKSPRRSGHNHHRPSNQRLILANRSPRRTNRRPAAFRKRFDRGTMVSEGFSAPEIWHESTDGGHVEFVVQPAGEGYVHPVTVDEVADRIERLPKRFLENLDIVQFSSMTKKRLLFPCYGMQWGTAVYLYPIEQSFIESYVRPPRPEQIVESRMYGGRWEQAGREWKLIWTEETIRDFYLNNVLIHEIGHIVDDRNTKFEDRERYANWFAVEYGYRASRGRR